ncbi:MAG: VanW family protein [Candidatus Levybacteria bacterium]|nr:VanW family protein [Candidatus Levybacteria bacterium]
MKIITIRKKVFIETLRAFLWFTIGAILAFFLLTSFTFIVFEKINSNVTYPGITVDNIDLGRMREEEVLELFTKKNEYIGETKFTFSSDTSSATISARELNFGYDENLIAKQVISLGRSNNFLSNVSLVFQAYLNGLNLEPPYHYSEDKLNQLLTPFMEKINKDPSDALFNFKDGKVTTFKPSEEGRMVDVESLKKTLNSQFEKIMKQKTQEVVILIPTKVLKPKITTDKANTLGIKELIGEGSSLFAHSIANRIYNITLAATRLNGILVAPNEEFSFVKALGDVSSFTGYKEAYIIQNGKTVLGDGGGICQVSTTLFRALLNSGLPILERYAHAYRVGYYEQDSPPGFDATVYSPSVDLKFKNDTGNHILIQTYIDPDIQKLTFSLYGTKDGRSSVISKPVITSEIPPPPDVYQDDPTLSKGTLKQVDFSAWGANVYFTREVTRNGKVIVSDKFTSNFRPWAAVYLRGTKE